MTEGSFCSPKGWTGTLELCSTEVFNSRHGKSVEKKVFVGKGKTTLIRLLQNILLIIKSDT